MVNLPLPLEKPLPSTCQLHHGDCLDVMPTLTPQSVQMVFADLPYRSKRYHSTDCKWDVQFPLDRFWQAVKHVGANNTPFLFTAAQPFTTDLINSNRGDFRVCLVWDKIFPGNFVQAKRMPMRHHEDVVVFARKLPRYNPQMVLKAKPTVFKQKIKKSPSAGVRTHDPNFTKVYTHTYPRSIFITSRRAPRGEAIHPTQKPVALLEWLVATYTNPGDTVLDPCFGSGTTAIACARLGRNFIGIEKSAEYFDVGSKRIEAERERLGL